MAQPALTKPRFEHRSNGFGIGSHSPRISWSFEADENTAPGWTQATYEIEIFLDSETKTFRRESPSNLLVPWPHRPLQSRECAQVRVRVTGASEGNQAELTAWSPSARIEVGLLEPEDWKACFITSSVHFGLDSPLQPIRFRKEFTLPEAPPQRVRLYITSLGVYDASINGQSVSEECMAPGWTSYRHRLNYSTLDVTKYIRPGKANVLAIEVAEGWYGGKLGFRGGTCFLYGGKALAAFCQLEVDGQVAIVTDENWQCAPSAISSSEIYNGETYDMRLEQALWNSIDFESSSFVPAKVLQDPPKPSLVAPSGPVVKIIEERAEPSVFRSKSNKIIVDFGQNLVGKVLIKSLRLDRDKVLTLRHAEVMEHGELGTRPLNEARCEDQVVSSGEELLNWTPKFTFHGFRYVQVEGWPGSDEELQHNMVALVMHSDIHRRGFFDCSNSWINRLHENIVWSMRGNFFSVPTDCPQRDERLGWTGDINVFAPTACYLYDTTGFLEDWLSNLAAEQLEDPSGIPGLVCPFVPLPDWPRIPQAIWHDVTVMLPEELHRFTSDAAILQRQFESMRTWLDKGVDRGNDGLWDLYRWQLADWLDPTAPPQQPGLSRTDSVLVADAYLVRTTQIFAHICKLLARNDLATKYTEQAATLKSLFQDKYVTSSGNLMSNTQTGLALAICFNLYRTRSQITTATSQLGKLVRSARFKIATGFAGTPAILEALTVTSQPQLAYRMLLQKDCPGWLFPIAMGATTVWERWDSMLPDGSINPGRMTSFNHYALGAVAHWLHSRAAGLSVVEPGWRTFRARPVPGGNLTWVDARFEGPCGMIRLKWWFEERHGDEVLEGGRLFRMRLSVPPNSQALVTLPNELALVEGEEAPERVVCSGVHEFECGYTAAEWPPKVLLPPNLSYSADMDEVAS